MKVITLHKPDFENHCQALFSMIDFKPDLVVGIKNGGSYVLDEYKKIADINVAYREVELQRPSTRKFKSQKLKAILKYTPYSILNGLRRQEYKKLIGYKPIVEKVEISEYFSDLSASSILVLDDALDTGSTMISVINALKKKFPETTIKSAVIVWTNLATDFSPDYYYLTNVLVRFPWSLDYKTTHNG